MRKKTVCYIVGVVACIVLLVAVVCIEQYYRLEVCNLSAKDGQGHGYYVYPNTSADSLLHLMQQDYTIGNLTDWHLHARHLQYKSPQPGYYHFPAQMGDRHLIKRLLLGEQTPARLTFTRNIRTTAQLSGVLAKQLLLDSVDIKVRLDSAAYMQQFDLNPQTAVCLFIPNTYEVYWTITPDQLFDRMSREYRLFWTDTRLSKAHALHLSPVEVYTLTSIVESETNRASEWPTIASLYLNRLKKGMLLQACPTVIYATGNFKMRRVLKRHLKIDSPYNTYKYAGLPPGPIRLAEPAAIDSVLAAPVTDYLYMCANPDGSGTHVFSRSYSKHASTAHKYQATLNTRHIHE